MLPKDPPKLQVGQKVRLLGLDEKICSDLDYEAFMLGWYNCNTLLGLDLGMFDFFGTEVTIYSVNKGSFEIEEDNQEFDWSAAWIEQNIYLPPPSIISLKIANTQPGIINCVKCGGKLKDPGMGPIYKHCPVCEP